MIRRPPRSPLFPYTTLSRSQERAAREGIRSVINLRGANPGQEWYERECAAARRHDLRFYDLPVDSQCPTASELRSEEHTSELQSPDHLVCRLLLEKKKTTPKVHSPNNRKFPNFIATPTKGPSIRNHFTNSLTVINSTVISITAPRSRLIFILRTS